MTHLVFAHPLEESSPRRCLSTSTEESLADKSARGWGCRLRVARAGGVLAVNQGRAALVLQAQHRASHKETLRERFRNRRETFPLFMILKAA